MTQQEVANTPRVPSDEDARRIASEFLGSDAHRVRRYPTGLCHYVYEVVPSRGTPFVVRISRKNLGGMLESARYWSELLRPKGVPLPEILGIDLNADLPYMILERLEGKDLGEVYASLSPLAKQRIAASVAGWQSIAATLPEAKGFGYASSYDDPRFAPSWTAVIDAQLDRSRDWMRSGGVGHLSFVDRVQELLHKQRGYLDDVRPLPFLDDTTTKNVLVSESGAHGVVDVDEVCFGDRLYVLALTNMALLSVQANLDYIQYWSDAWSLSPVERTMVKLYTAAHCTGFIGELGQRFNRDSAPLDMRRKSLLEGIFESLIA